ncbi:epoxide hydrolase N-terminal domain-containing protein [Bacillus sonorensis]|uniref:epoxide hydrolase N-terminal domain-containing protein n=1 Tax=Bacillus sonorensis TaxID=119858 RepID=UPI0020CEFF97|nr:epoxide hydrolase N-terminal domain-containing protein [Bacillus sonorensis]
MTIKRFQIQVSDEILNDLQYRIHHIRWPDQLENADWERGTELNYLKSLVSYWRDHYDWCAQEAKMNRFSQFCCKIDGIDVHFVHERGKGPDPLPLILTHGCPTVTFVTEKSSRCLRIRPAMAATPRTLLT